MIPLILPTRPSPKQRANGATGYVLRRFHDLTHAWWPVAYRASMAHGAVTAASVVVFTVGNLLAFGLGAWLYWSGDWPAEDPDRQQELFDDLLAEMETMVSGGDRYRWSPDDPWPRTH